MTQSMVALMKEITNFYYVGLCSIVPISTVSGYCWSIIQFAYRYWERPGLIDRMFAMFSVLLLFLFCKRNEVWEERTCGCDWLRCGCSRT